MRAALPRGDTLPDAEWRRRHRWLLGLLWLHVPLLVAFGLAEGRSIGHMALEGVAGVGVIAVLATWVAKGRKAESAAVAIGLLTSSALAVHLSGGVTEAHFHFFVMIVALTLYEDWTIFLLATAYVVLHHGVMGVLAPEQVYGNPMAVAHPWRWAGIHAGFIAAAGLAAVVGWRLNEDVRRDLALASSRARDAEAAARDAAASLERSNRDLQQFASVASHDLKEPLRTVSGFLGLLERRHGAHLDAEAQELIGHANEGARRMGRLIDDLLRWSQAGDAEAPRLPVDLRAVAEDVRRSLEARIEQTGGTVVIGELPEVRGDRRGLEQALQNLVGNALKFHGDEPPVVHVEAEGADDPTGRPGWAVRVRDNGIGIRPEHAGQVFAMFRRLHGEHHEGTGIGLAVVARVAEAHGGTASVAPAEGGGSTFTLWLPR